MFLKICSSLLNDKSLTAFACLIWLRSSTKSDVTMTVYRKLSECDWPLLLLRYSVDKSYAVSKWTHLFHQRHHQHGNQSLLLWAECSSIDTCRDVCCALGKKEFFLSNQYHPELASPLQMTVGPGWKGGDKQISLNDLCADFRVTLSLCMCMCTLLLFVYVFKVD